MKFGLAQVAVSAPRYLAEDGAVSRRDLLGHQSKPGAPRCRAAYGANRARRNFDRTPTDRRAKVFGHSSKTARRVPRTPTRSFSGLRRPGVGELWGPNRRLGFGVR